MAGNKKPARKRGMKTGSAESVITALAKARKEKLQLRDKQQERINKKNSLPMGHPLNRWMIESTFAPLERGMAEHERTGTVLHDEAGDVLFYDGQNWIIVIPALQHMAFVFDKMAQARGWSEMPPGLRVYAIGLQIGRTIDAEDFAAVRETFAWMRTNMATLTPTEWTELFEQAHVGEGVPQE